MGQSSLCYFEAAKKIGTSEETETFYVMRNTSFMWDSTPDQINTIYESELQRALEGKRLFRQPYVFTCILDHYKAIEKAGFKGKIDGYDFCIFAHPLKRFMMRDGAKHDSIFRDMAGLTISENCPYKNFKEVSTVVELERKKQIHC